MSEVHKKIYWDSCAFIHFFQAKNDFSDALDHIDQKAQAGGTKIVTCSVAIAEVCKLPELGLLPLEQSKKILRFMENDYVEMWQADRLICEEAHHIIRLHGVKPMDAIHLSAAINSRSSLFLTTDTKKYRRGGLLKLDGKLGNPPLPIKLPSLGVVLPLWAEADKDDVDEGVE